MVLALAAGISSDDFTETGSNTSQGYQYVCSANPATIAGYVAEIRCRIDSDGNSAWPVGVADLSGTTVTPTDQYVVFDPDDTNGMEDVTFVEGVDYTAGSIYINIGQYICFDSYGFNGNSPIMSRNIEGTLGYGYNQTRPWQPDYIDSPLTVTLANSARCNIGFYVDVDAAELAKRSGVLKANIGKVDGVGTNIGKVDWIKF